MRIHQTPIIGLVVVDSEPNIDHRGFFLRLYCQKELQEIVGTRQIMQMNQSHTSDVGAVRGLHYQCKPCAEMKMVRCLRGKVWDVTVDLRAGSPTFLQWHAEELSAANNRMMIVPEGCAHGFQVLEADSDLLYLHTAAYAASAEGGVRPTDPKLSISWPLPVRDVSERDNSHALLTSGFAGLEV